MTPAHEARVKPVCRASGIAGLRAMYPRGRGMTGNIPIWERVGAIIPIPAGLPGMLTNNYDLAMQNYKVALCHYALLQHAMTTIKMAPYYDCYKLL
jgi:hypothetical protein